MKLYLAGSSGNYERERTWRGMSRRRLVSYFEIKKDKKISTFYYRDENDTGKRRKELLLDSGAFSAWSKGVEINFQEYIDFCIENGDYFDWIVNLDVIPGKPFKKTTKEDIVNSSEQGWKNYDKMIASGIPKEKLIHVFHQGEEFSLLERMVEEIEYIGISPANDKNTQQKMQWLDKCMKYIVDENGYPKVKFHGFGVTSLKIMLKYPFYSIDSTTWLIAGNLGYIFMPRLEKGQWIYDETSWRIAVSSVGPLMKEKGKHLQSLSPGNKKVVLKYITDHGYSIGTSEFKTVDQCYKLQENERWVEKKNATGKRKVEVILEPGISNTYQLREEMNILYFRELEKHFPKYPSVYIEKKHQNSLF
jgi:hypothetical protein